MSEVWTVFEHHIWKILKEYNLNSCNNFILAVSGGLDSMVLLEVFLKLKPEADFKVVYYHHGDSATNKQEKYRDQAYEIVKNRVLRLKQNNKIFYSERSRENLFSEEQMRTSRWNYIKSLKSAQDVIVTAHHLDDQLETMLLKMIRGTSFDGLVTFKIWNQEIFRPFLETAKTDLLVYAQKQNIDWIEDPSNQEDDHLRNWIREKWLKDLDAKVPCGRKNMAKSLLKIVLTATGNQTFELEYGTDTDTRALNRQWYVSLSKSDQLRSLALFLKKHQIFNFTSGQLEEVRKRLDKNQKDLTFELLGKKWVINVLQIMLE